jgi:DNA repair protein RadA/Sms
MGAKAKVVYTCGECGGQQPKWGGQCPACGAWNSLSETPLAESQPNTRFAGFAPTQPAQALGQVAISELERLPTGLAELDRVLGGGLVAGSVVLIGGDPGIGKSTLLLQSMAELSKHQRALYVTGEESAQQVALRARRLGLQADALQLLAENRIEAALEAVRRDPPAVLVVDSIQTVFTDMLQSAPGSVAQVRECAAQLVRYAKQTGAVVFMIGHVTKEGTLAGPRVLEHMVDTVLYFEGESSSSFRILRAIKNRFGAVNEIGVFAMTEKGLREVGNPSAMFVSRHEHEVAGSVVLATQEGTRPLLVEVQALVDNSQLANPRRLTVGLDHNRLAMLLAVLHRHAGIGMSDQDVFVNVVGGVRVLEPAADLSILLAVVSSYHNRPLDGHTIVFGEVGLAGEVRPVQRGQDRIREAGKLGYKRALVPKANCPKKPPKDIEVVPIQRISEAVELAGIG